MFLSRGEENYEELSITLPTHSILNQPNTLTAEDLKKIKCEKLPVVYNAIRECSGCAVIVAKSEAGELPAIIETGWGTGRMLLLAMPLDKVYALGDGNVKNLAKRLMRNLLHYGKLVKAGAAPPFTAQTIKPDSGYQFEIQGIVYLDHNSNNKRDADEPGLPNIPVSDGADIVFTDDEGKYRLNNSSREARFVFVSIPANYDKSSPFYYQVVQEKERRNFDIGLRKAVTEEQEPFSFVQITDVHISGFERTPYLENELKIINTLNPKPAFIVATGDLVNDANEIRQLKAYVAGIKTSSIPVFNVFGNNDRNSGSDRLFNYNKYCGPDYYSFDYANCHFIVYNIIQPTQTQKEWFKKDLELLGKNKLIILFQHYFPKEEQMKELEFSGVNYVFTGHWHSTRIQDYGKMRLYNIPPLFLGGIDISPSGFLEAKVSNNTIFTEYHYRVKEPFVLVSSPGPSLPVYTKNIDVVAEVYNPNEPVIKVECRILKNSSSVWEGKLQRAGKFTWRNGDKIKHLRPGWYKIHITASTISGKEISGYTEFEVIRRKWWRWVDRAYIKQEWTMFMGSATHNTIADDEPDPPFAYEWAYSTGGWIDFASPIIAEGKVFIASKRQDDTTLPRIFALNAKTGALVWQLEMESPVEHSLAYAKGKIFAVCQDGTVLAVSASSGKILWQQQLGSRNARWIYSAPALKDNVLYAGNAAWLSAINCNSGEILWTNKFGVDWISAYASPAVTKNKVIMGSMWQEHKGERCSLYAIRREPGEVEWAVKSVGFHSSPTMAQGKVYVVDTNGKVYEINSENGEIIWQEQLDEGWACTTPAIKDNCLIVGSGQGRISSYNLETKQLLWETSTCDSLFNMSPYFLDFQGLVSSPTIAENRIYIGDAHGNLKVFDFEGRSCWQHNFGVPIISTPAVSGNCLFVCTITGNVYCLRAR